MISFTGKTVLITGGVRGLGLEIARTFADAGASLVLNYFHSRDAARAVEAEFAARGVDVHLVRGSVARDEQVGRMFEEIRDRVGHLDVLVNNAASGALLPPSELSEQHWNRAWDTNVRGSWRCAEAARPLLAARGGGTIVNLSSFGAGHVIGNYVTVGTSKAAVESLTRYLAAEYATDNIRVNTASGGLVQGSVAELFPDAAELRRVMSEATPFGRLATERELANIVLFLASDLSSWVTGQTLLADGGLTLAGAIMTPPAFRPAPPTRPTPPTPSAPEKAAAEKAESAAPEKAAEKAESAAPETAAAESAAPGEPADEAEPDDAIVVVGMGLVCPGADSPAEFLRLRAGADDVLSEPGDRWDHSIFHSPDPGAQDRTRSRRAGFVTNAEEASGGAEYTTVWLRRAIEQALTGVTRPAGGHVAYLGYTADGSQHLEEALAAGGAAAGLVARLRAVGHDDRAAKVERVVAEALRRAGDTPATRLPHAVMRAAVDGLLPDGTPVTAVDTACSSSLYAVDLGIKALRTGAATVAICGGAHAMGPRNPVMFGKLGGLSESDRIRPFDSHGDGVLFADGAAVVVLKTLRQARADGDEIHGVILGVGTSSDGRGKAIHAPNADGQRLAVRRAYRAAGVEPEQVDWVAAHATGTRAGDSTEFSALKDLFGGPDGCLVTSNKAQIGHTGWAAGVVSLIEVLLSLRAETIAPQQGFVASGPAVAAEGSSLTIPKIGTPWPRTADRPRLAGVSGFGFGGTNAHVVVADRPLPAGPAADPEPRPDDPVVVVGWSTHLPGEVADDDVTAWLTGRGAAPARTFGDDYPAPPVRRFRLPPPIMRSSDRAQLMALECVDKLIRSPLGDTFDDYRDTTGVFVGQLGPTRHGALSASRCYLTLVEQAVRADPELAADEVVTAALDVFTGGVRRLFPPIGPDTLPGLMTNIVPARVANYFDFHGVNMAVDTGLGSSLEAIRVASKYLHAPAGETPLDLAVVCGVNGNSTDELAYVLGGTVDRPLAEGAFTVVLTRRSTAEQNGLTILGTLRDAPATGAGAVRLVADGSGPEPTYLGGDAARLLVQALVSPAAEVEIGCVDPITGTEDRLTLQKTPVQEAAPAAERFVVTTRSLPPLEPVAAGPNTLVLTDGDLTDVAVPADVTSILVVSDVLAGRGRLDGSEAALAVHDGVFKVLSGCPSGVTSVGVVLLGAVDTTAHPALGLFDGLLKSLQTERPGIRTVTVAHDGTDPAAGLAALRAELAAESGPPLVIRRGRAREAPVATARPARPDLPPITATLGERPVVLATGGARGLTAEIALALAERAGARLWLLGTVPLDGRPEWVTGGSDEEFARHRADYLRTLPDGGTFAQAKRETDRMAHAREVHRNLARMAAHVGADNVTYVVCDVTDGESVDAAVRRVLARDGRVDLVIHGAGVNHSAALGRKTLDQFHRVRDVKVRGYLNLKRALAATPPRVWCNFGSVVGFAGGPGEADYASANAFLATAARAVGDTREITVEWPLWREVGFAANSLTKSFLSRTGGVDGIDTAAGVGYFLSEVADPGQSGSVVYLQAEHRDAILGSRPALLGSPASALLVGGFRPDGDGRWTGTLELTADDHEFLRQHLVRDLPTVPGAFLLEAAAEAACAVSPGRPVTAVSDVRFLAPVRRQPGRPNVYRVAVETSGPGTAFAVTVTGDVHAPDGTLLRPDRLYCQAVVHLGTPGTAPADGPVIGAPAGPPIPDPYLCDNEYLRLAGLFATNTDGRLHEYGCRATFQLPEGPRPPRFDDFRLPAMLLDGLFRVTVLPHVRDGRAPLVAPTAIDRIDFYDSRNDLRLAAGLPAITLTSDTAGRHAVATSPDGRVLVRVRGLTGAVLGEVGTTPALAARA
ncbi:hypothetical protein Q0Z83_064570 [Actinoplanes sichuanensis]|uniref:SDR family oxidoreductase n=1 Tax=Actinoplanes sichuanensis TaxID=512349 RepID=A0ABW4ALR2_9ACTN|nr:SDR family oxidoreductase [Actinoplanes sichuanensis]BEL08266.1 hypothetical protein Q0Z83_064570 [Actinoplanes sichuanensis]